jgi:diacylglycerol kinase (ATP)
MHAWKIAEQEIDPDKFCAIAAVGGDGTIHEVVNGLMHRKDNRRLPVAFIPNGTGNDTLFSLGVTTINQALDFILKGDVIKMDLN